jgi:hypothetical protein
MSVGSKAEGGAAHDAVETELPALALRALSDAPLDDPRADALAFGAYEDALAGLLDHPDTGTPLTLAINAPWGAGKSTLARMIRQRLRAKPAPGDSRPHVVCWFNAWMHDDAPSLATAFAAEVARVANRERHPLRRILSPLPRALWSRAERWFFWGSMLSTFALLFTSLFTAWEWILTEWHELGALVALLGGSALAGTGSAALEHTGREALGVGGLSVLLTAAIGRTPKVISAAKTVASFLEDPEATATLGCIAEVRAQLGEVIAQARRGARKFVVFVDDLERCHPPRAIDLLEVVSQLLDHEGVVVVIMADMPAVSASADIKYKDLAELHTPSGAGEGAPRLGTYGRLYVHKIVQLQFDLPPNSQAQIHNLLQQLAVPLARAPALELAWWRWLASRLMAAAFVALRVLPVSDRLARRRLARLRERIDRLLQDERAGAQELARILAGGAGVSAEQARALVRERELLQLMNDEQLLNAAYAEIAEHIAPYPRTIKRFLNHVRVLAAVADARGVLGGTPQLSGRHLGRWAALKERWPLTAAAVMRRSSRLAELEQQARGGGLQAELLAGWGAESWDAAALADFLRGGTVGLAEVAERLIQYVPQPTPPNSPWPPVAPSSWPAPAAEASGTRSPSEPPRPRAVQS